MKLDPKLVNNTKHAWETLKHAWHLYRHEQECRLRSLGSHKCLEWATRLSTHQNDPWLAPERLMDMKAFDGRGGSSSMSRIKADMMVSPKLGLTTWDQHVPAGCARADDGGLIYLGQRPDGIFTTTVSN